MAQQEIVKTSTYEDLRLVFAAPDKGIADIFEGFKKNLDAKGILKQIR